MLALLTGARVSRARLVLPRASRRLRALRVAVGIAACAFHARAARRSAGGRIAAMALLRSLSSCRCVLWSMYTIYRLGLEEAAVRLPSAAS